MCVGASSPSHSLLFVSSTRFDGTFSLTQIGFIRPFVCCLELPVHVNILNFRYGKQIFCHAILDKAI